MSEFRVVLVTAPRGPAAARLARGLIGERLAACVNEITGVVSHYEWRGKKEKSREILLIIKTRKSRLPALMDFVKRNHPYKVPEVVSLPILEGSRTYLDWIKAQC